MIFYFQPQLVEISDNWICKFILSDKIPPNGINWQYITAACWPQYANHVVSCNKLFPNGRRVDSTAIVEYGSPDITDLRKKSKILVDISGSLNTVDGPLIVR